MIKRFRKIIALCALAFVILGGSAMAFDLKDLIGVIGGGMIVSALGDSINDFINTVTFNRGVGSEQSTKVVPIVSVGSGTAIGAAQVSGPEGAVGSTKAVAQLELSFQNRIRIEVLIPIDSTNPLERFRRVQQVGVSAVIDYRL